MAARSCRLVWVGLLGTVMWAEAPAWAGPASVDVERLDAVGVASALEAIDACVRHLNPDVDVGYDRIVLRCPMLARRLEDAGVAVWLPRDWQRSGNDLSIGGLRALRELLLHELPPAPSQGGHGPGVQPVSEILASLRRADDEHSGWWARSRVWLRTVFARGDSAGEDGWLGRMMGQSGVSQAVLELVSYGALALVVVLAVGIVVNEMWVGGIWRGRGRRRPGDGGSGLTGGSGGAGDGARLYWAGVLGAPVARRLGLLLELIIRRLNEGEGVRLARGLTARELLVTAPLAGERDRERLGVLVRAAEKMRYSGGAVSEREVAEVMEEGRLLLEGIGVAEGSVVAPGAGARGGMGVSWRGVGP